MILKILSVCIMLFFAAPAHAKPYEFNPQIPDINKGGDFRGFVWGVSPQDVQKYEAAIFYKQEANVIFFIEQPSKDDFRRLIKYEFLNNKLVAAQYGFEEFTTPSPDNMVDFYERFKARISLSKGEVVDERFIWRDKIYERFPEMWNGAIRSGDLKIESIWNYKNGTIATLSLSSGDSFYLLNYEAYQGGQEDSQGILPIGNMPSFKVNP